MGEMADLIINGEICDLCMSAFVKAGKDYAHGHPVSCNSCWKELNKEEKKCHTKQEPDVKTA